jgi:hypothetical protein
MIPNEVFHYTKKDTAIEKIFFEKKIRLGQLAFTNDPRESKTRLFLDKEDHKPNEDFLSKLGLITHEVNDILSKEWKILCLSQNHPDYEGGTDIFRRGDCRPRMWANYAENHRGICLRFDGAKLNQQIENQLGESSTVFHGPVIYDDKRAITVERIDYSKIEKIGVRNAMRTYLLENWGENFLVKAEDWKTEYEYRWLVHNKEDRPEYISIEGVLTGVLIGVDFPKAYIPLVKEFCSDLGIPAGKILWQNGNPLAPYLEAHFLNY